MAGFKNVDEFNNALGKLDTIELLVLEKSEQHVLYQLYLKEIQREDNRHLLEAFFTNLRKYRGLDGKELKDTVLLPLEAAHVAENIDLIPIDIKRRIDVDLQGYNPIDALNKAGYSNAEVAKFGTEHLRNLQIANLYHDSFLVERGAPTSHGTFTSYLRRNKDDILTCISSPNTKLAMGAITMGLAVGSGGTLPALLAGGKILSALYEHPSVSKNITAIMDKATQFLESKGIKASPVTEGIKALGGGFGDILKNRFVQGGLTIAALGSLTVGVGALLGNDPTAMFDNAYKGLNQTMDTLFEDVSASEGVSPSTVFESQVTGTESSVDNNSSVYDAKSDVSNDDVDKVPENDGSEENVTLSSQDAEVKGDEVSSENASGPSVSEGEHHGSASGEPANTDAVNTVDTVERTAPVETEAEATLASEAEHDVSASAEPANTDAVNTVDTVERTAPVETKAEATLDSEVGTTVTGNSEYVVGENRDNNSLLDLARTHFESQMSANGVTVQPTETQLVAMINDLNLSDPNMVKPGESFIFNNDLTAYKQENLGRVTADWLGGPAVESVQVASEPVTPIKDPVSQVTVESSTVSEQAQEAVSQLSSELDGVIPAQSIPGLSKLYDANVIAETVFKITPEQLQSMNPDLDMSNLMPGDSVQQVKLVDGVEVKSSFVIPEVSTMVGQVMFDGTPPPYVDMDRYMEVVNKANPDIDLDTGWWSGNSELGKDLASHTDGLILPEIDMNELSPQVDTATVRVHHGNPYQAILNAAYPDGVPDMLDRQAFVSSTIELNSQLSHNMGKDSLALNVVFPDASQLTSSSTPMLQATTIAEQNPDALKNLANKGQSYTP
ncbi:hypothetical protein AB6D11_05985 [Vibrio splendidus]